MVKLGCWIIPSNPKSIREDAWNSWRKELRTRIRRRHFHLGSFEFRDQALQMRNNGVSVISLEGFGIGDKNIFSFVTIVFKKKIFRNCPGGTPDSSPAIYRWERSERPLRPGGTLEC